MSQLRGVSFRLKNFLSFVAAKNMYYACVYSVFSYCISVWGGVLLTTHRGDKLAKLHFHIVQNLFSNFFPPGTCLFKATKILKLKDAYRFRVASYMYRIIKRNLFPTIQENLVLNYPQHGHSTRYSNSLILPFPRVELSVLILNISSSKFGMIYPQIFNRPFLTLALKIYD